MDDNEFRKRAFSEPGSEDPDLHEAARGDSARQRLMQAFQQGDDSLARHHDGLGDDRRTEIVPAEFEHDIEDLIEAQGLTVDLRQRDDRGLIQESRLFYETEAGRREVWFMTDQSLASKIDLVQEMDLAGIAIWQLGYEKPEYWEVIRSQLVEDPVQIQREINQWLPEH